MADNLSKSAESAASTQNETLVPGSLARPGGSGSSEWDPALQLAAGDGGSSSSTFRLPALNDNAVHLAGGQTQFPAGQLELWEFAENFPNFQNNESSIDLPAFAKEVDTTSDNNSFEDPLGVHYRHYHSISRLSWTNTPHNSPSRLESNSPHLHNNVANAAVPPFQTHDVADATWNPSLPSGFGSLNDQPLLVPHANLIAMPTIGNVQGFIRTPGSFENVAGETPAQEPSGFLAPLPAPPLLTVSSAPFRYPRIHQLGSGTGVNQQAPPVQQPWPRSNAAVEYANAIWSRAEQLRPSDRAPHCRVSDPRQTYLFKSYRPWTTNPLTPLQRRSVTGLAANTNVMTPPQRFAVNTNGKRQRAHRSAAADPHSFYARNVRLRFADHVKAKDVVKSPSESELLEVQLNLASRLKAQKVYLKGCE